MTTQEPSHASKKEEKLPCIAANEPPPGSPRASSALSPGSLSSPLSFLGDIDLIDSETSNNKNKYNNNNNDSPVEESPTTDFEVNWKDVSYDSSIPAGASTHVADFSFDSVASEEKKDDSNTLVDSFIADLVADQEESTRRFTADFTPEESLPPSPDSSSSASHPETTNAEEEEEEEEEKQEENEPTNPPVVPEDSISYAQLTLTGDAVTTTMDDTNNNNNPGSPQSPKQTWSSDASTTSPSLETDEECGRTASRTFATPSRLDIPVGEQNQEDEDESTIDWEAIKAQRAQDRKLGCIMFFAGLVGVIIATILLLLQTSKSKNENNHNNGHDDPILALLDLPPDSLEAALYDPFSPQARAVVWMKNDPWWETYTYTKERARQRLGLAILYYATFGRDWTVEDNQFLSYEIHECEWLKQNPDYACNVRYQLTSLGFKDMNLRGTIPPEVFSILAPNTLEQVLLSGNDLKGTIASEIGVLKNLEHLDLSQNQFSGSFPTEIASCQQLQLLVLNSLPNLEGTIPPELISLRRLQGLWWRDTAVRGSIPSELGAIASLQVIDLSGNLLRGSIPHELFDDGYDGHALDIAITGRSATGFSGLQQIRLSQNRLVGTLPVPSGSVLYSLATLDVADNNLDATQLPTHLAQYSKLSNLYIGGNPWEGAIPSELGLMSNHLESLGLQEAHFVGPIPTELLQLSKLQSLYLHNNLGLKGTIVAEDENTNGIQNPIALGKLSNLKDLSINGTPLSGKLPQSMCAISVLSFTCNPDQLCGCDCTCSLAEEDGDAPVTATPSSTPTTSPTLAPQPSTTAGPTTPPISPSTSAEIAKGVFVANLPVYTQIAISYDPDGPQALALNWLFEDPDVLSMTETQMVQRFAMATLYYSLYGAEAAATETTWLVYGADECTWAATDKPYATCHVSFDWGVQTDRVVKGLFLDALGLIGTLPPEIGLFSSLESIQGANSNMTGAIPSQIGLLRDLETLRLPGNKLRGPLPSEIGTCTLLKSLHLSFNGGMSGSIPSELGLLKELQTLDLSQNSFSGDLPKNLPGSLQDMDLSGNRFRGHLPIEPWSVNADLLTNLRRLKVSESEFNGPLATEIGRFTQLSELNLSQNQFSGGIPSELGLCAQLTVLDASSNDFTGPIPPELGDMTLLKMLHLDSNELQGIIPSELGSMPSLEELTLHDNKEIGGRFPDTMNDSPSLTKLSVEGTAVGGRIPPNLCSLEEFSYTCSTWFCGCGECSCQM